MKSIICEASTMMKAVEQGWIKAGKPTEFSVKVFEQPQRNFFGLTTSLAKIGIFFLDKDKYEHGGQKRPAPRKPLPAHTTKSTSQGPTQKRPAPTKPSGPAPKRPAPVKPPKPAPKRAEPAKPSEQAQKAEIAKSLLQKPTQKKPEPAKQQKSTVENEEAQKQTKNLNAGWDKEMSQVAEKWLQDALALFKKDYVQIESKMENKKLFFTLEKPLLQEKSDSSLLFKSLASLIMQSLRTKYKKELYGFGIFITNK